MVEIENNGAISQYTQGLPYKSSNDNHQTIYIAYTLGNCGLSTQQGGVGRNGNKHEKDHVINVQGIVE